MEVKSNKKLDYVSFGDLSEGAVFQYCNDYYMKFYKGNQDYNAINLNGYHIMFVKDNQQVIHAKGYFLLED